jgi:hypothetical protein
VSTGTAAWENTLRNLGRRHPDANVFQRLEQRLRQTASAKPALIVNTSRSGTLRTPANEDTIIAAVEREPWRISSDIVREMGLSNQGSWKYREVFFPA